MTTRHWLTGLLALVAIAMLLLPVGPAHYRGQLSHGDFFSGSADCGPAVLAAFGIGVDPGSTIYGGVIGIGILVPEDSVAAKASAACAEPARHRLLIAIPILFAAVVVALTRRRLPAHSNM